MVAYTYNSSLWGGRDRSIMVGVRPGKSKKPYLKPNEKQENWGGGEGMAQVVQRLHKTLRSIASTPIHK
jgi:hypothetical protein